MSEIFQYCIDHLSKQLGDSYEVGYINRTFLVKIKKDDDREELKRKVEGILKSLPKNDSPKLYDLVVFYPNELFGNITYKTEIIDALKSSLVEVAKVEESGDEIVIYVTGEPNKLLSDTAKAVAAHVKEGVLKDYPNREGELKFRIAHLVKTHSFTISENDEIIDH